MSQIGSRAAVNPLNELKDDLKPAVPYVGRWLIDFTANLGGFFVMPFLSRKSLSRKNLVSESPDQKGLDDKRSDGHDEENNGVLKAVRNHIVLTLFRFPAQFVLTMSALLLNALASFINNTGTKTRERTLRSEERVYLEAIFAGTLDYDAIRIQSGGIKERLGIAPQAVGNDIFLRQFWWGTSMVNDEQSLTRAGMKLLGHEACHVWQYQTSGAGYIGDSLLLQVGIVVGRKLGIRLTDGYDLRPALHEAQADIRQCNVEQQAVMAELIGAACAVSGSGRLSRRAFVSVSKLLVDENEFGLVTQAHTWFKSGKQ